MKGWVVLTWLRRLGSYLGILLLGGLIAWLGIDYLVSRSMPDLRPWHRLHLEEEFRAEDLATQFDWDAWMQREDQLFESLHAWKQSLAAAGQLPADSRFLPGGNAFARRVARDWNRSRILEPQGRPRAVALLLHGLSDSPYSLRSIALTLQRQGMIVMVLRLPGHGTVPAALDSVHWQDWQAAVRMAARHVETHYPDLPFWIVGYSMGAALAVEYSLDGLLHGHHRQPDGLVLVSPALGVSPFARLANLQRLVSGLPGLERMRWLSIQPEYDPFKYQSFTKNAGRQISLLIETVYAELDAVGERGLSARLPRILAFQSLVDETVSTVDLVDKLFAVVNDPRSELVLFDINRESFWSEYVRYSPEAVKNALAGLRHSRFRLTVVTNRSDHEARVQALSRLLPDGEVRTRPIASEWPDGVYSLSHIALPFAPDDPVYGLDVRDAEGQPLRTLGNLAVRGERNVLSVSAADVLRLRANPFHAWMLEHIREAMSIRGGPGQ